MQGVVHDKQRGPFGDKANANPCERQIEKVHLFLDLGIPVRVFLRPLLKLSFGEDIFSFPVEISIAFCDFEPYERALLAQAEHNDI